MSISSDTIERVRQALDIVDVIGAYVSLKRSGASYKALSPFNKEKTPSFFVDPNRQMFKCFSSGHGGDVFKFVMLYENIDFPSAVRRLADKAGIEIQEDRNSHEYSAARDIKKSLLTLHSQVMERWRGFLLHSSEAEIARSYMKSRDIPLSWVEEFQLGYAKNLWDDLLIWGRENGYSEEILLQAGLLVRNEHGKIYDRFRDRLVFAIQDDSGQIIGFSARALDPEAKGAKYINSPETPLFIKSKILFGLNRAKRPILNEDEVILCEGQIDVLRCHASGILNVVAPLGTAFTPEHARLISRNTKNVILCLDGDSAGQKAAGRVADVLLAPDQTAGTLMQSDLGIRVVRLPPGKDPDTLIVEEGVDAMKALLAEPMEYVDFLVDWAAKESEGDGLSSKRSQAAKVAEFLARVPNQVLREQLKLRAAGRMNISSQSLEAEMDKQAPRTRRPAGSHEVSIDSSNAAPPLILHHWVRDLIWLSLLQPASIPDMQSKLSWEWIEPLPGADFLNKLFELFNADMWSSPCELTSLLDNAEQNEVATLLLRPPPSNDSNALQNSLKQLARSLHAHHIQDQINRIQLKLKETPSNPDQNILLLTKQTELIKLKNTLTADP
ncbi:MAG: DNA primase [Candidatus Methylacidiphilales bacterium]